MSKHYKPNPDYNKKTKAKLGNSEWWQPRLGEKEMFRVAPAWDKRGIVIVRRVMHFGFELDGKNRAFPCLEDNEPWLPTCSCPTCHVISKMAEGDEDERKAAKDLTPGSPKFVCQGIDVNHPERGIQKWASPLSFGKYFISLMEDEDIEDITDPAKGFDIIIEKSGKGRGTKYEYRLRPKPTAIKAEGWESQLSDLIKDIEVLGTNDMIDLLEENYGNAFDIKGYLKDFEPDGEAQSSGKKESSSNSDYTADDIDEMSMKELKKLIKDEGLEITKDDYDDEDELRDLIMEELGIEPF